MTQRRRLIAQVITSLSVAVLLASACGIGPTRQSPPQKSTAPTVKRAGPIIDRIEPDFIVSGATTTVTLWGNLSDVQKLAARGACTLKGHEVRPSTGQLSFSVEGVASPRSHECRLILTDTAGEVTTLVLPVRDSAQKKGANE